jgi:hypothetical protein
MPREGRAGAAVLALRLAWCALSAASPSTGLAAVAVAGGDSISAALCGRGEGLHAKLANALDEPDPLGPPSTWRDLDSDGFRGWLGAPICVGASELETELYRSRRRALEQLSRRLERARVTEEIGPALARFRGRRPSSGEWPSLVECDGCAALRSSAARVADIAARWPPRESAKLGARLVEAARREPLVAELCAAQPPAGVRAEVERRFRYYSWTADGARLLEVAALFEQPEVVAGCQDR